MSFANLKKTHETYQNNSLPKINKNDVTTPITFNKDVYILIPNDGNSYVGEPQSSHMVSHENNKIRITCEEKI